MPLVADSPINAPESQAGPAHIAFVSSFTGDGCNGNRHAVLTTTQALNTEQALSLSQQLAPDIVVVLNEGVKGMSMQADFYHYGRRIEWCGSGILAAARVLENLAPTADAIQTRCSRFPLIRYRGLWGFSAETAFSWRPARHRTLWRHLFGRSLINALESPATTGYSLIELADELAVSRWQPKLRHLQRYTQRALIVTAKAHCNSRQDYVMRYFAPQYGNNEDSATGSANALLIPYWAHRLQRSWLRGRQLSASGGQFYGRSLGRNQTVLFGKTRLESN